jgi:hypothetical protein
MKCIRRGGEILGLRKIAIVKSSPTMGCLKNFSMRGEDWLRLFMGRASEFPWKIQAEDDETGLRHGLQTPDLESNDAVLGLCHARHSRFESEQSPVRCGMGRSDMTCLMVAFFVACCLHPAATHLVQAFDRKAHHSRDPSLWYLEILAAICKDQTELGCK